MVRIWRASVSARLATVLVPAAAVSASGLSDAVPESAPCDRCWNGACRQDEHDKTVQPPVHPLRPATPSELETGLLSHTPPKSATRVGKIGTSIGLRLLESFYAVVGMPNRFVAPTTPSPAATERIDVGLRFVKKF
jgi:hypothetical protein